MSVTEFFQNTAKRGRGLFKNVLLIRTVLCRRLQHRGRRIRHRHQAPGLGEDAGPAGARLQRREAEVEVGVPDLEGL